MVASILADIDGFLTGLEETQTELEALHTRKRAALGSARSEELLTLASLEQELVRQLHEHQRRRQRILLQAQRQGTPARDLSELIEHTANDGDGTEADRGQLQSRIAELKDIASRLRHGSWVHWIIAKRTCQYHAELLELIAQGGHKQTVYAETPANPEASGGVILDHSV